MTSTVKSTNIVDSKIESKQKQKVVNLAPYQYIHVKDNNTSIINVVVGPKSCIIQEHEELVFSEPRNMIVIPPMNYCRIKNPFIRDKDGNPVLDKNGQVKLLDSEVEIRLNSEFPQPFFLYYGEEIQGKTEKLKFIETNTGLYLRCNRNFKDENGVSRLVGEMWMVTGPQLYIPNAHVDMVKEVKANIIKPCHGLRLKAKQTFTKNKEERKAGEEWIVRTPGAYIPDVYEEVVSLLSPNIIGDQEALYIRAVQSYKDCYGVTHKAGDEWLISREISSWHLLDVYEILVKVENLITLGKDDYVVITNPYDPILKKNQKGSKKLIKGEKSFFLQPGEVMESSIQKAIILNENESVLLQAKESFKDTNGENRIPGDKWMIRGPYKFVPALEVEIIENRNLIALDEREGIYVRDCKSGNVRSVIGKSYMLEANEELWNKDLSEIEENILESSSGKKRIKYKVVSYQCPYNSIMQIYNFKSESSRIVFGPELVMLDADEQFSLMFLSGKTPKIPGVVKTLYLSMGPTFSTDKIEVETSDHALLIIEVSYNWYFDVKKSEKHETHMKIFSVRDCIGEMCSIMASRVRGAVAEMTLNEFHKSSARTIRKAVMGINTEGKISDKFLFENNLLAISNVDIKEISTKDKATMEKLQVTVNKAIEFTTKSQEEDAKAQAEAQEQEAKSLLQRKINEDNRLLEELKKPLYEIKSKTQTINESGEKEALAKAESHQIEIESKSKIEISKINKDIAEIKYKHDLEIEKKRHSYNLQYQIEKSGIELNEKKIISELENSKLERIIQAIGQDTLVEISKAGPNSQVKMLEALGLEGYIMTDGNNPINLFNFANNIANTKQD